MIREKHYYVYILASLSGTLTLESRTTWKEEWWSTKKEWFPASQNITVSIGWSISKFTATFETQFVAKNS